MTDSKRIDFEQQFHDVYEDFFIHHGYISCAPHSLRWQAGGIGQKSDFLTLLSKVHLRTFLGISPSSDNTTHRNDILFYDHHTTGFVSYDINHIYPSFHKQQEQLHHIIQEFCPQGLSISILSETGRGHGLGFTGARTVQLASYLIDSNNDQEILMLAHRIESIFRNNHAFGDRGYMALQHDTFPHLYFKKNDDTFAYGSHHFDHESPFDIALVFSGETAQVEKVDEKIHHNTIKFSRFSESFVTLAQELGVPDNHPNISLFEDDQGYKHVTDALLLLNSMIIQGYYHLTYSYDDSQAYKILDHIEDIHGLVSVINGDDLFIDTYMHLFNNHQSSPHEKTAIIPAYSGKYGGGYICFGLYGKSRHTRSRVFEEMHNSFPQSHVEYLSYRDPIVTSGLTVRQDLTNNIYSHYLSSGSAIYHDNTGNKHIGNPSELLEQQNHGIVLDAIHNKVYINGIKATKDKIKSQATTVEVVGLLLQHMGQEISNLSFGPSTYTRQQNQMLGKIIGPLRKIFLEQFDEELPITCTGSLRDFSLMIQKSKTPIGIIRKITHD